MSAKIRHIAIVSDQYALEGRFYEAVFGMRTAADKRPERAVTVSDGYVGLNINPRRAGRAGGLDHSGVEVEDAERVCARLRERYPAIKVLKRPGTRPFAGISTHDPAGNLFDLSQENMENRTSDRKSTRLNSSHLVISYAVFCLKKKKKASRLQEQDVSISAPSQPQLALGVHASLGPLI